MIFPTLPATVYTGYKRIWDIIPLAALPIFFSFSMASSLSFGLLLAALFVALASLAYKFAPPKIIQVDLSPTTVSVVYDKIEKNTHPLTNYMLLVDTFNAQGTRKSYRYNVKLALSSNMDQTTSNHRYEPIIPLQKDILHPADVAKYIAHIQAQFPAELEVAYENEHILKEIKTGAFIKQ